MKWKSGSGSIMAEQEQFFEQEVTEETENHFLSLLSLLAPVKSGDSSVRCRADEMGIGKWFDHGRTGAIF
jgi:hypothetical protein